MKRQNLVQFVCFFQENKIYNFKIHLFSLLNTKQTNNGIFLTKTGENFNLPKIFWNVSPTLRHADYLLQMPVSL